MNAKLAGLALIVAGLLTPFELARGEWREGIGVLGDSYSDEYQFYPPHRSTARNWVEMLAATRGLNFGEFSSVSRGEPRNQGYAYNWARSDATTEDMIVTGQHTGLAAQVARGEVRLVVVFVGGNDFINGMRTADPVTAFPEVARRAEANLVCAVETILAAGPDVKLVVATVPDIRDLPEFREPLRSGQLPRAHADAATLALRQYNSRIRSLAAKEARVTLLDLELATRIGSRLFPEAVIVAGRPFTRSNPSNDADHLFLADVRHIGTVGQGLLAELFVATINRKFGVGVPPLSDQDVLEFATNHTFMSAGRSASPVPANYASEATGPMNTTPRVPGAGTPPSASPSGKNGGT